MSGNEGLVAVGAVICTLGAVLIALAQPVEREAAEQRARSAANDLPVLRGKIGG